MIGSSRLLYRALRGVIEFLRPIPSVALIPLAILIYGTGLQSKVFLAAFASFWQLLVATLYGVQDVDPVATDTARSFGLGRIQRLFRVTLPSAVPYIATGIRIASAVSLILTVTAELVIGSAGPRAFDQRRPLWRQRGIDVRADHRDRRAGIDPQLSLRPGRAQGPALASLAAERGRVTGRRILEAALEIAVPLALLSAWWFASAGSDTYYFPPLEDILRTFNDTWLFERVGSDVVPSLTRMALGLGIATILAIVLGIALGSAPRARRATAPIVEFLRAIPPPALLPFAILVIGVGSSMKVFIIAFVCLWPILLNTIDGVRSVDTTLTDTTRVYAITSRDRILRVLLPAATPQIFAGLRTSLSLALILMVISEMVASTNGIGYFVLQSQRTFAIPEMWSGILLLGILGYTFNGAFVLIEKRVLRWHRGARASVLG